MKSEIEQASDSPGRTAEIEVGAVAGAAEVEAGDAARGTILIVDLHIHFKYNLA